MSGYPTSDTFGSLIDEVIVNLQGFGALSDQVITLKADILPTDLVLPVDSSVPVGRGLIEIDEELIYITRLANDALVVQPWGRGWKGTQAAPHGANSAVYISPVFPRSIVSREINNTIRSVYPNVFAVKTDDITARSPSWQYELPADADRILAVDWKYGTIADWQPLVGWEHIFAANTTDFPSGKALAVSEPLASGSLIHVTYAAMPSLLTAPSDLFTVTGLPASCRDVVIYGAASRLIPWMDAARIPNETVVSDAVDQGKVVGTAVAVGREMRNLFQMRLAQEQMALQQRYPLRSHRVR